MNYGPLSLVQIKFLVKNNDWEKLGKFFDFKETIYAYLSVLDQKQKAKLLKERERGLTHKTWLFFRQKGICFYCRQSQSITNWSVDHVIPMSEGGSNALSNKIGACKSCNNLKQSVGIEEFLKLQGRDFASWKEEIKLIQLLDHGNFIHGSHIFLKESNNLICKKCGGVWMQGSDEINLPLIRKCPLLSNSYQKI